MAVDFNTLNLQTNEEVVPFQWGDQTIGIRKYLPIENKDNIIQRTLSNSRQVNGLFNPMLIEMYFNLFLIFEYSDILFTDEDIEDAGALYDALESSGFINAFVAAMNPEEYTEVYGKLMIAKEQQTNHGASFVAVLRELMDELPKKGKEAIEIMEKFKPELFQNVIEFAKAANGNREIQ